LYKQKIIEAIQNQNMLSINFRKESDGSYVERDIAPYDIYPKEDSKSRIAREMLLGYEEGGFNRDSHVVTIYLDNIHNISVLDETFDGYRIRRIIDPKQSPNIPRNW